MTITSTPVMLFGYLGADHQAATDFTWDRGVLLFAFDPQRIDAETALFVAGYVAGGPVFDLDAEGPTDTTSQQA
jgi:hypothetical protein